MKNMKYLIPALAIVLAATPVMAQQPQPPSLQSQLDAGSATVNGIISSWRNTLLNEAVAINQLSQENKALTQQNQELTAKLQAATAPKVPATKGTASKVPVPAGVNATPVTKPTTTK